MIYDHSDICALWPSAGLGLAAVLWRKWCGVAGVFLGSFLGVALFFAGDLGGLAILIVAGVTACGAVAEAMLGRWIVVQLLGGQEKLLDRFKAQFWFPVVSLICSLVSATIGIGIRVIYARIPGNDVGVSLLLWAVGDTLGILLITLFLLALLRRRNVFLPAGWWMRASFAAVTLATVLGVFSTTYPLTIILFIPILWSCFYLPQHWSLGATAGIAFVATAATISGYGPLVSESSLHTLLNLYPFILVTAVTTLTVSAGLQRRVRRSELEDMLQASPVGIGWSDKRARSFTQVNQLLARELGYESPEQLMAIPNIVDVIYDDPRDHQSLLKKIKESRDGRGNQRFVARRKDGSKIWLHIYARRVVRDRRPQIVGFYREVTTGQRRRRLERIVRKLAKRTMLGDDLNIWVPRCLKALRKQLGASAGSLWLAEKPESDSGLLVRCWTYTGDSEKCVDHPTHGLKREEVIRLAIQTEIEEHQVTHDRVFPLELQTEKGNFLGIIVVIDPDWLATARLPDESGVTLLEQVGATAGKILVQAIERERARRENTHLLQQLIEAHNRNNIITKYAQLGVFEAAPDGVTRYGNDALLMMEGILKEEKPRDWKEHLHPDHRQEIERAWDEYVRGCHDKSGPEDYAEDQVFLARGEKEKVFAVRAQALRHGRDLIGFVGAVMDVTLLREKEQDLKIQLGEINHDIPNGLTGLEIAIARLRAMKIGGEVTDCLDLAEVCWKNIAELAQKAGQVEQVEFNPHLEAGVLQHWSNLKTKIMVAISPTVPHRVKGPRRVISQVLGNLVGNCRKLEFCNVWVDVDARRMADENLELTFVVEDDGSGLPNDIQTQLQKETGTIRRTYAKKKSGENGRGLLHSQLALARVGSKLACLKGRAQPPAGSGAAFNKLQFKIQVQVCPPAPATVDRPSLLLAGRGPVLLVDNDEEVRAGLAWKLLSWGIDPLTIVSTGEEAVRLAETASKGIKPFELVLMDIRLGGGIDGYEATRQIRLLNPANNPPCRILSISGSEDDAAKRQAVMIDDQIAKSRLNHPIDLARKWFPNELAADPLPAAPLANPEDWPQEFADIQEKGWCPLSVEPFW